MPVIGGPVWRARLGVGLAFAGVLVATIIQLRRQGRLWWCACGRPVLWDGDIWSPHNSQHLLDPYSFTHILHGVVLCGLLWLAFPAVRLIWRLWLATMVAALWEIIENSHFIIMRYREATIGQGYIGDSIGNSLGDIGCCALGFLLAWHLGLRRSIVLFVAIELILLALVRDNLTLNVLMLIHPIGSIKAWQMVH